jgi:hypothetical protein
MLRAKKRSTSPFSNSSHHSKHGKFLAKQHFWAIDITQYFWTHLKNNICIQMQLDQFVHNSAGSCCDPNFNQRMSLQAAFSATTIAKDTLPHSQRIAEDTVQSSIALATGVDGVCWIGNSITRDIMTRYGKIHAGDAVAQTRALQIAKPSHAPPKASKSGVLVKRAAKAHKEFNEYLAAKKKIAKSGPMHRYDNSNLVSQLKSSLTSDQIRSLLSNSDESPTKKRHQGPTDIQTFLGQRALLRYYFKTPHFSQKQPTPHISLPTIGHDLQMKFSLLVA